MAYGIADIVRELDSLDRQHANLIAQAATTEGLAVISGATNARSRVLALDDATAERVLIDAVDDLANDTETYADPRARFDDWVQALRRLVGDLEDYLDAHTTLTGTVAKTATSATLTGTGTQFLHELTVGQVIDVPGTAVETRYVSAIASNTSLTVSKAFANTASGQTATASTSQVPSNARTVVNLVRQNEIDIEHVLAPSQVTVATFTVTGSGAGTYGASSAVDHSLYGPANLELVTTSLIGAAPITATLTCVLFDGTSESKSVTIPAATANGTVFPVGDSGDRYRDVSAISITGGTASDAFSVRSVAPRTPAL